MMNRLAAQLDKWNWRARIERIRSGPPSASCDHLGFYEDDDCFIRYRKAGTGPSIVFLCDGPATLEVYDSLIAMLAPRFTVVALETPRNGFSVPKPSYNFSFHRTNDVVARFLRSVAGENAILAFSCGASYAAVDIAHRYPELCSHLTFCKRRLGKKNSNGKNGGIPKGLSQHLLSVSSSFQG